MSDFQFQSTSFKVTGFAELNKNLEGLTAIQRKIAMEPLLVRALEPMRETAAAIAPDDPKTGNPWDLGDSIKVGTRQRSGGAKTDRAMGEFSARAYMGPTKYGYPQAIMMEFGTKNHLPQPYMRPTWDTGKQNALKIISDGFAKQVHHAVRLFKVSPNA